MYTMREFLAFFLGAAIAAALIVLLLLPPSPYGVVPAAQGLTSVSNTNELQTAANGEKDDNLAELLRSAAMEDNTIIMTFTNEAWSLPGSLMDIFLESFRVGVKTQPLLKHLVIFAMDVKAFERCQRMHPLCYSIAGATTADDTNFKTAQSYSYLSKGYLDLVWVRNKFQSRILALGHGFVMTDVDLIWFRNPLLRVPVGADITISCDYFEGYPYDLSKKTNSGFMYVKSSARTAAFIRDWYEARTRFPTVHDQAVLEEVKHELVERHGVLVQYVDTIYLGSGCQQRIDFHNLCTFHVNCYIGLEKKTERLVEVLDEWKRFKAQEELLGSNSTALVN